MANRVGIELLPHACRLVEVSTRARLFGGDGAGAPRVRAFREIPCSAADPDALSSGLRQALKGRRRRASVAVWGLRSSHQLLLLPPAAPADLEAVARREARTGPGGLPSPPLADVVVPGGLRDGRRETGYVAVSADELGARLRPILDAGVKVESVGTPALAHAALVGQRRALLPDSVVALLSVNALATAVTVVHGSVVLFARELPWGDQTDQRGDEPGGAARAPFAARLAAEVRRSLGYLRQLHKVDVDRVLVCGDCADLRSLTGPLINELSLDVETLDVGDDLDLSKLAEPSDQFRSRLGAWRTALALAAASPPMAGLTGADARPAVPSALLRRAAGAAVAGALITAAGGGLLSYLSAGVTARQERLRRTIAVLEPELQRQSDERHRAAVASARDAALAAFASQGPRLARVLEAFSQAAPPDLALSSLRVEPGPASWRLVVEGRAEGRDAGAAQATLKAFLTALEASPFVGRPASTPSLRTRTSDPDIPVEEAPSEAAPIGAARPVQPVESVRPAATGPSYIEVARDGRLYRIPLRRQAGNLEAARKADEARRLQEEALARQAESSRRPYRPGPEGTPERHPGSVVEFTLRYEVPR